ncbi:MAG: hypothetical protein U0R17_06090 [Acidimicrobiia bacterium]
MVSTLYPQFGTDGVRGTYGKNFDEKFVYCLGISIARTLGTDKTFLVGRDTRTSGEPLAKALISGLTYAGANAEYISIMSTPGIAFIAQKLGFRACAITASHNPAQDNGVKVFDIGGKKITEKAETEIESELEKILQNIDVNFEVSEIKTTSYEDDYVNHLLKLVSSQNLNNLNVVLDCANGAAYSIATKVFKDLGAQVVAINTKADGAHINDNCGATHLEQLQTQVLNNNADLGFAFDGDADRVIAVDSNGIIRDGDFILALFAQKMSRENILKQNAIAVTSMSNGALKTYLSGLGIDVHETDVGDKFVLQEIVNNNLSLGGEQSGHIIRTDIALWGDGIANALFIAKYYSRDKDNNENLSSNAFFDFYEPMIQIHEKVHVANKSNAINNDLIIEAVEHELNELEKGSRIVLRPSGTEEVVRISVESFDAEKAQSAISNLSNVVKEECK